MPISRLIWIILLASGSAAADQGPLAHRGDWALGVALPASSGSSFSLWKVRSPTTAMGLALSVSWSYADSTANSNDPAAAFYRHSLSLRLSPTIKHYRPLHDRIAPFTYGQLEVGFSGDKRQSEPQAQHGSSSGSIGLALGLGVEWFPFQRISLGGQTGLSLRYRYGQYDTKSYNNRSSSNWYLSLRTFQSSVKALMYF